jgi:four helix bundle protein
VSPAPVLTLVVRTDIVTSQVAHFENCVPPRLTFSNVAASRDRLHSRTGAFCRLSDGTSVASPGGVGVRNLEELAAYQLARELKLAAYQVVASSSAAARDFSFRDQLFKAVSGTEMCIAEGFTRRSRGEFAQFLRYALASLKEAELWLLDGADRGHYQRNQIETALVLVRQCRNVTEALWRTLGAKDPPRTRRTRDRD